MNQPDKQCTKEIFKRIRRLQIAGKLNNVFASVFTLENKAIEKREEKTYYVKERSSSDGDVKGKNPCACEIGFPCANQKEAFARVQRHRITVISGS